MTRSVTTLLVPMLTFLAAAPAAAQDRGGPSVVEASQVSDVAAAADPDDRQDQIATPQAGRRGDAIGTGAQPGEARGRLDASPQLSEAGEPAEPVSQLSPDRDRRATPQLYRGGRTAQPAQALSVPAEGRTAAVARVEGVDRCDQADATGRSPAGCDRVIETRAAEFATPDPTALSPEQRLLIEQRSRAMAGERAAAQRLATTAGNPDELQDQQIASQVLRTGAPAALPVEEEPAALSAELQAVIEGIATALTQPQ